MLSTKAAPIVLLWLLSRASAGESAAVSTEAAPVRFARLSVEQGLSDSHVWSIVQDHQGFMWFGTDQGGLNRYDGHECKVYRHDNADPRSVAHNFIWALYEDRAGTLWIGTNGGGLDRYDRAADAFVHYRHDAAVAHSLPHDNVKAIFEDAEGTLWVGTDGGLCRLDRETGTFTVYKHEDANPDSLGSDRIFGILQDRQTGLLWLAAIPLGIDVFDPRRARVVARHRPIPGDPSTLSGGVVRHLFQDRTDTIWAATREGLNRFEHATGGFTRFRHDPDDPHSLGSESLSRVHEDSRGRLWISTYFHGLERMDRETGRFVHHRHDAGDAGSLGDDVIRTMYEDRTGALWLGTQSGGVSRLAAEPESFVTYRHNPGDTNSVGNGSVLALHEDRTGRLWIGTTKGLDRLEGGRFTRFRHDGKDPRSLSHDDVRAIAEDTRGVVWIGTNGGGLCRAVSDAFRCHRADPGDPDSLMDDRIETLHAASDGGLWIAVHGLGLDYFDGRRFIHYRPQAGVAGSLPSRYVLALVEGRGGSLWVGTNNIGLVHLDRATGTFTAYPLDPKHAESEAANRVHAVYDDGRGSLWVGAEPGLFRFDPVTRTFPERYTTADGLPADAVVSIRGDGETLWLGTSAGLSRFDPRQRSFRTYGRSDGLQSNKFAWRSCALRRDGRLAFGGVGGFSLFDPRSLPDNPHVPPVVLTRFELFRRPVEVGPQSPLRQAIHVAQDVALRHDQSVFSIQFAALDYASPEKNRYAYKMEGFDADWTLTDARRPHATYTNLDAGTYVFRVRGSNNHGRWNEQGTSLRIVIHPPWWRRTWFTGASVMAAAGLLFASYRLRVSTLAERERRFRTLAESTPDVVARFDRERRCRYVNAALEEHVGRKPADVLGRRSTEMGFPGDLGARWDEALARVFGSGLPETQELQVSSAAAPRSFESRFIPEKAGDGHVRTVVAITRDITVRKEAEERVRASLDEKVVLLKEVHHRVKNNLQVICSLLNLQAATATDRQARELLQESHGRIRTMALIHERLYEARDLARVDATDYLRSLVESAILSYGARRDRIQASVTGDEMRLDADTAIPLGLLVNELATNALKHAFPGDRAGTIGVELRRPAEGELHLRFSDDGVGLPDSVDVERPATLGLQLVQALVAQLNGKASVTRAGGISFDIRLAPSPYRQRI